MLSAADNNLLTTTGPGTAMGALFRRFWLPALLSRELPEPDGPPKKLRLLGEDLLAFRDTNGRVGLVDPRCPHRGANLYYGRNEEGGLRCAFHGWKFDVGGRCLQATTFPQDEKYPDLLPKLGLHAYPVEEAGGIIWAYLGPPDLRPPLPRLELLELASDHRFASKKLQECNWAQACDGALDTAHFSFLHMSVGEDMQSAATMSQSEAAASGDSNRLRWMRDDGMPRFSFVEHPAGVVMGAARHADGEDLYWRISQFLFPNHALVPSTFPGETYHSQIFVPIDDDSCWIYCTSWNPARPIGPAERARYEAGHSIYANVDADYIPIRRRANDYLLDRDEQKRRSFTGIKGVSEQDQAIQDSQGFIVDRTREHLGPTDAGVVRFRRLMLDAAKALAAGHEPAAAQAGEAFCVRGGGAVAHRDVPLADVMRARFGDPAGLISKNGNPHV